MIGARHIATALLAAFGMEAAAAQDSMAEIKVPSGHVAYLQEILTPNTAGAPYRLRMVVPELRVILADPAITVADMEHICAPWGLAQIKAIGGVAEQIVISLAERPSEFGVLDPDLAQTFEAFSVINDTCIWEAF